MRSWRPYRVANVEAGVDLVFFDSRLVVLTNYFKNEEDYDVSNFVYSTDGWEADVRHRIRRKKDSLESGLVVSRTTTSDGSVAAGDDRPLWQNRLERAVEFPIPARIDGDRNVGWF
jgi:hypothetical protein